MGHRDIACGPWEGTSGPHQSGPWRRRSQKR